MQIKKLLPTNVNDISIVLDDLNKFMNRDFKIFYPKFSEWYNEKVIKQFYTEERKIFIISSSKNIYGISIIKVAEENKICSFFLLPEIRKNGFGIELLRESLDCFQINQKKTIITVPEERMFERINKNYNFTSFLQNNGFILSDKKTGIYRSGKDEFIFNYKTM